MSELTLTDVFPSVDESWAWDAVLLITRLGSVREVQLQACNHRGGQVTLTVTASRRDHEGQRLARVMDRREAEPLAITQRGALAVLPVCLTSVEGSGDNPSQMTLESCGAPMLRDQWCRSGFLTPDARPEPTRLGTAVRAARSSNCLYNPPHHKENTVPKLDTWSHADDGRLQRLANVHAAVDVGLSNPVHAVHYYDQPMLLVRDHYSDSEHLVPARDVRDVSAAEREAYEVALRRYRADKAEQRAHGVLEQLGALLREGGAAIDVSQLDEEVKRAIVDLARYQESSRPEAAGDQA